jgi:SAM-dependent methyltransferase
VTPSAASGESTAYDVVLYPGRAQAYSHPRRSATLARLMGFEAAPVGRCRVLELGCSNGANLAAMAVGLTESEFVGVDLSRRSIALGRELVAEAGLGNVRLLEGSFAELSEELGEFDYVIAHGLYSWVPPEVQDALLATFRRFLAPNGVGYVSYAVYPGCHLRELVRDMMLFHTDRIDDPLEKVREGVRFVNFVKERHTASPAYAAALAHELERFEKAELEYVFHDDFASDNAPVYFGAFVEHLRRHDLDFLAESMFSFFGDPNLSSETQRTVEHLSGGDVVAREQYLDFLRGRAFRQTLICRARPEIARRLEPERVLSLYASTELEPVAASADATPQRFRDGRGAEITTAYPALKLAFALLAAQRPRALSVEALFRDVTARLERAVDPVLFAQSLVQSAAIRVVDLHVEPPCFTLDPGERPLASPVAREQARSSPEVTNLAHRSLRIGDPRVQHLLSLLDGRRTRSELVEILRIEGSRAEGPRTEAMGDDSLSSEDLDRVLRELAAQALLLG